MKCRNSDSAALIVMKTESVTEVLINPIIRTRTRCHYPTAASSEDSTRLDSTALDCCCILRCTLLLFLRYDRRSAGHSVWNKTPILCLRPDLDYCLTVAGLLIWGALSDERTGLSFAIATGPRQRSHFWVRVP
jgi:hypothetical protein